MNFDELFENYENRIEKEIQTRKWGNVFYYAKNSPDMLIKFIPEILKEWKKIEIESFILPEIRNQRKIPKIFILIIEIIKFSANNIPEEIRKKLYKFYLEYFPKKLADLIPSIGDDLGKYLEKLLILKNPYVLRRLCEKSPKSIIRLLPDILNSEEKYSNREYMAYFLIKNNPTVLNNESMHDAFLNFFKNLDIDRKFQKDLVQILEIYAPQYLNPLKTGLDNRKKVFTEEFSKLHKKNFEEFFRTNKFLRENLDLFSDEEIENIINKIQEFDFFLDRSIDTNYNINIFFLELVWQKKLPKNRKFLQYFVENRYDQVLRDFFIRNPEEIYQNLDLIEKNNEPKISFFVDLLSQHFNFFHFKDPMTEFSNRLKELNNYGLKLIQIFYRYCPEYKEEIIKVIIRFFETKNLSFGLIQNENGQKYLNGTPISILLASNYPPIPELPIQFVNDKLREFFSNFEHRKYWWQIITPFLAKNYYNFDNNVRNILHRLIINGPNYHYNLSLFASYSPDNFIPFLDEFLNDYLLKPEKHINHCHILRTLLMQRPTDEEIKEKILIHLNKVKRNNIKCNIYGFFGEHQLSFDCFEDIFEKNEKLPFSHIIQYRLEQIQNEIEIRILDLLKQDLDKLIEETKKIWNYIRKNENDRRKMAQGRLKYNIISLRIKFIRGQDDLMDYKFEKAKQSFDLIKDDYIKLAQNVKLANNTKDMLILYSNISDLFSNFIDTAISIGISDNEILLNKNLQEKISELGSTLDLCNLRKKKIFENLCKCEINISNSKKIRLQGINPGIGCPLLIEIEKIELFQKSEDKPIYEWDENLFPIGMSQPIRLNKIFKDQFKLKIYFKSKPKSAVDYQLSFSNEENMIVIRPNSVLELIKESTENKKNREFRFRLGIKDNFNSISDAKFIFQEKNPCNKARSFILPIIDETQSISKIERQINSLDTSSPDSTDYIKRKYRFVSSKIKQLSEENQINFLRILEKLAKWLEIITHDPKDLIKSADEFWKKYEGDKKRIEMETKWFQPEIKIYLKNQFGIKVIKEFLDAKGSIDLLVHNIPVECKVLTDKGNHPENKSGIEILKNKHLNQTSQYLMHTRCGFLIAFDYRSKVEPHLTRESVIDRIKFIIHEKKLMVLLVILGNMGIPSKQ